MKKRNTKLLALLVASTASVLAIGVIAGTASDGLFTVRGDGTVYQTHLGSENGNVTDGSYSLKTKTADFTTDGGNTYKVEYKNVKAATNAIGTIKAGGRYALRDAIFSMSKIVVSSNASAGDAKIYWGLTSECADGSGDLADGTFEFSKANFFKIVADNEVTVNSIAVAASCSDFATGEQNVKLYYSSDDSRYTFIRSDNYASATKIVVPDYYLNPDTGLPERTTAVSYSKAYSSYPYTYGVAYGATKVESVYFPETIQYLEKYNFTTGNNLLTSITFPRDLKKVGNNGAVPLKAEKVSTIYYNSIDCDTQASIYPALLPALKDIYVSYDVEKLYDSFWSSYNRPSAEDVTIHYEGTTAEWQALTEGLPYWGAYDCLCSDTSYIDVTFSFEGGSLGGVADTKVVNRPSGSKVANPGNPTYGNDTKGFDGWYTDETYSVEFDFANTYINSNTTIYAKWSNYYDVTFSFAGGKIGSTADSKVERILDGHTVSKPTDPTYVDGTKDFAGWYADSAYENAWNFESAITGNTTIYAKFSDWPAGHSASNPIVATGLGTQAAVSTDAKTPIVYVSYTAPAKDRYYFTVDGFTLGESSPSSETMYTQIGTVDESGTYINDGTNTGTTFTPTFASATKKYQASRERVAANLDENETIILALRGSYYAAKTVYGTFQWSIATYEHDTPDEAEDYVVKESTSFTDYAAYYLHMYKFTAPETKTYWAGTGNANSRYSSVTVASYDSDWKATELGSCGGTGDIGCAVGLTEGKTYYIGSYTNEKTGTSYIEINENVPSGISAESAAKATIGGGAVSADYCETYKNRWFTFDVAEAGKYMVYYTGSYSNFSLLKADTTTKVTFTSIYTTSDYNNPSSYGYASLEAGTYYVKLYSYSSNKSQIKVVSPTPGSRTEFAIESGLTEENLTVNIAGSSDGLYYKFKTPDDSQGNVFTMTSCTATLVKIMSSSTTTLDTLSVGVASKTLTLDASNEYYFYIQGEGEATITLSYAELPPDGKSRSTAYSLTPDENGRTEFTDKMLSSSFTCYAKWNITQAGRYRYYSRAITSADSYYYGVFLNGSNSSVSATVVGTNDDIGADNVSAYSQYVNYKYDFYVEFDVTEADLGIAYFSFKLPAKNSNCTNFYIGVSLVA